VLSCSLTIFSGGWSNGVFLDNPGVRCCGQYFVHFSHVCGAGVRLEPTPALHIYPGNQSAVLGPPELPHNDVGGSARDSIDSQCICAFGSQRADKSVAVACVPCHCHCGRLGVPENVRWAQP